MWSSGNRPPKERGRNVSADDAKQKYDGNHQQQSADYGRHHPFPDTVFSPPKAQIFREASFMSAPHRLAFERVESSPAIMAAIRRHQHHPEPEAFLQTKAMRSINIGGTAITALHGNRILQQNNRRISSGFQLFCRSCHRLESVSGCQSGIRFDLRNCRRTSDRNSDILDRAYCSRRNQEKSLDTAGTAY